MKRLTVGAFAVVTMAIFLAILVITPSGDVNQNNIDQNNDSTTAVSSVSLSPSSPLKISIPAINLNHSITKYTNKMVAKMIAEEGGIYPISLNDIGWWAAGGRPGRTPENTVDTKGVDYTTYLYGHSSNNDDYKLIFDDLDLLKAGDEITITANSGKFKYHVSDVFVLPKSDLSTDSRATVDEPGRLVLISCWKATPTNYSADDNVVVIANMVSYSSTK